MAFVYREEVIESAESHDIRKICDGNDYVGKHFSGLRNIRLQIHGNHCHNDDANDEQNGHC